MMESLSFGDDYTTGPRERTKKRVSWHQIRSLLQGSSIPMTPTMVAEALQMERRAAHNQLARAEKRGEVYQPDGNGAYALVSTYVPVAHKLWNASEVDAA